MGMEIDALDRALARSGTPATLRRQLGSPSAPVYIDVEVRAFIRTFRLDDQTDLKAMPQVSQQEWNVTISPTEIKDAQWPGGMDPDSTTDDTIVVPGDQIKWDRQFRNIEDVEPIRVGGELVRINLRVLG